MSTNSDIDQRAKNTGAHGLSSAQLTVYSGYQKHPTGNFRIPKGYSVDNKHKVITRQAPQNSIVGSSFLNGSETQFKIDKNLISVLTHAYIQVKITNSTGGTTTLSPIQSCIDRIEILGTASNVLASITGQQLMLSNLFLHRVEFDQLFSYLGFADVSYSTAGDAITNGTSVIHYIPLFHLFSAAKLHLAGLKSECFVRVLMQNSTFTLVGGTHPTITDVNLILKGFNEPRAISDSRNQVYNDVKLPIRKPFLNWIVNKDVQTLAVSTQYSSTLSSIKGIIAGLLVVFRPTALTAANQSTYQAVTSLDVQLASGESLLGYYVRLHDDYKIEAAEMFPNLLTVNKNIYAISFSEDMVGDYISGQNNGYNVFTGNEKLVFTTNGSITPGTFNIEVHALTHEHLLINKGQITSQK